MNLVDRAKNIILAPAAEWNVIEPEVTPVKDLYLSYIVILAAISPVATFIGTTVFGIHAGFGMVIRQSFLAGLVILIVSYAFSLAMVFVFSLVIDFLAPKFGGLKNPSQAFKFAAYSLTPVWIAGILNIIPLLGVLGLLAGLYGIYVFFLGAPVMMKVARDKAAAYTAVVIVVMIVIGLVIGAIWGAITYSTGGLLASGSTRTATANDMRAEILAAQIAAAANQAQVNATANGNATTTTTTTVAPANQAAVAGNAIAAMAAVAGNGAQIEPVDKEILKGMLPDTVAGMPRTSMEASRSGIANMQVALADANYGDGQTKHMDLKVTDMGGAKMLGLAAAWAMVDVDQSSDHGYEKTGKVNGRPTHEKFDKNGPNGEYAVLIGDRFVVEADGNVDMSVLKDGVAAIDVNKLEAMKNQGVH